jgi:ABC-type transporter lipoprotein component MlaA
MFDSQHLHDSSQESVNPLPETLTRPSFGLCKVPDTYIMHRYIYRQNRQTENKISKKSGGFAKDPTADE